MRYLGVNVTVHVIIQIVLLSKDKQIKFTFYCFMNSYSILYSCLMKACFRTERAHTMQEQISERYLVFDPYKPFIRKTFKK